MTRWRRWWLVVAALALVIGTPLLARARPVGAPDLSATRVLATLRSAADHPYSGRVDMVGNLDLPVTSRFTDVGALLGERTTLRVWWRGSDDWRVDKLLVTGETDLVHDAHGTVQWSYEDAEATRSVDPEVRLPRSADLLPPELAARAVEGAGSVARIAGRRVAGIAAPGIRIVPADRRSSVDHVDLWVDPASAVVLRLDAYAAHDRAPSFSTRFTSFSVRTPAAGRTRFVAPAGARTRFDDVLDIADAANQYAPFDPPPVIAGLSRAATPRGAVGVYGSGLTRVLAIPLRHRDAHALQRQLRRSAGAVETDAGIALQSGPLGVLVSERRTGSWLVSGSVTRSTLLDAAADLAAGVVLR
jgi:hypothetical protein